MSVFFIFSFPFLKLDITFLSLFMLIWKLSFIHSLLSSTIFHIWPMENYSRVVSNRCSLVTIIFNIGNRCKKVFFLCFFQLFSPHYHRFCLLFWFFFVLVRSYFVSAIVVIEVSFLWSLQRCTVINNGGKRKKTTLMILAYSWSVR